MPDYSIESQHHGRVAGIDEAGRGPLAGPVVAAAVVFTAGVPDWLAAQLDDSKLLTAEQRESAYTALMSFGTAEIAIGAASVRDIERLNILHASLLAMGRAVLRLPVPPDIALVDGNRPPPLACPVRCVVGGDALCLSIAAASIVAKVVRDRTMARLACRFPGYGWERNAGYPTHDHRAALKQLGPTPHHRAAFGTVRLLAQVRQAAAEGEVTMRGVAQIEPSAQPCQAPEQLAPPQSAARNAEIKASASSRSRRRALAATE
jgi:ribonuclease HII